MKPKLHVILLFMFIASLATSCVTSPPLPKPNTDYTLINKEKDAPTKCILDIRLSDRISEDEIKNLANYIKQNEGTGCSPLFIFYFLPNQIPGIDAAWAYSHFNPQLEVKINGMSLETKATLEASIPTPDPSVIGTWIDTGALSHTIVIRKLNGSFQMTTVYGDGSGETTTLDIKVVNGEERLYEPGDYMVIEKDGSLAFYDSQGLLYRLPPK